MPSTINGIGTTYYGKKNIFQRQDSCEHCGRDATLLSYDTQLFFTIFFIPIVPLGKKRIIDQCSCCTRHRAMPLKQWETARASAMEEVQLKLRQYPSDSTVAQHFLNACTAFQNREVFEQGARDIRRVHSGNAEIMNHLAGSYFSFAMWNEAEDASRAALKITDTPETREFLAYTLIKQGKPDDAAYYMSHLYNSAQAQKVGYLFLLAEAFQSRGEHRKALQVLDQCAGVIPGLAQNKDFKKLRKISDKNRDSNKPIKHASLASGDVKIKSGSRVGGLFAAIIGPLIILGLLAFYLFSAFRQGQEREVYLANGLSKSYRVRIGEQIYNLNPLSVKMIRLPEGRITVEMAGDEFPIESQTAVITTPFLTRPFTNRTYILNPDLCAVVLYEKTHYVVEGKENTPDLPKGERRYLTGDFKYEFKSLDYEFSEFPDEIKMSSGSKTESRDRVMLMGANKEFGGNILFALMLTDQDDKAVDLAKRRLNLEPDQIDYLNYLSTKMETAELLEFMKPNLEFRPLRVEWHRLYQNVVGKAMPNHDVTAEYKALLDADPDNRDLRYLYGRTLEDPDAAMAEYRAAATGPEPSVYGLGALAYRLVSQGEFAEAAPWAEKAYALDPENNLAMTTYRNALLGSGSTEKLMEMIAAQQRKDPRAMQWYIEQVTVEAAQGQSDNVEATISRAKRAAAGTERSPAYADYIEEMMRSRLAYMAGDFQKYAEIEDGDEAESRSFHVAITLGEIDQAVKSMDEYIEYEDADWSDCLLLYSALAMKGDAERAEKYLAAAAEYLKMGEKNEIEAASWLTGGSAPAMRDIEAHPLQLQYKPVVVMALGAKFPEIRTECFALARRLNINREYPWHFINSMTSGQPAGGN